MPKLWDTTVEEHRRAVHMAILDTAAALVNHHGLTAVTMSRVAQDAGIGRATLYKYFRDVESILTAWHERQINGHLQQLAAIGASDDDAGQRLHAVLRTYAKIQHDHRQHDPGAALHHNEHVSSARRQLRDFLGELLAEATAARHVRGDILPGELADFCLTL